MGKSIKVIALVLTLFMATAHADTTAVIVAKPVPIKKIWNDQLRMIFTLDVTHWDNGKRVELFIYDPEHPLMRQFLRDRLGLSTIRYKEMLYNKVNSGRGIEPHYVKSEAEMIHQVSRISGGIGFINGAVLINEETESVKVVSE